MARATRARARGLAHRPVAAPLRLVIVTAAVLAVAAFAAAPARAQPDDYDDDFGLDDVGSEGDGGAFHHDIDETTVAVGGRFACALADAGEELGGHAVCWGRDRHGISQPATGLFIQICAAEFYACGVAFDGSLKCWGEGHWGDDKAGSYLQVSCGMFHTCAITKQNQVRCWGQDVHGQSSPPEGEFVQVSCGRDHTCGIRPDGRAECWGYDYKGAIVAPPGQFVQLSASPDRHTCGLLDNGMVQCWGSDDFGEADPPESDGSRFLQVTAAKMFSCGLLESGLVRCWGEPRMYRKKAPHADTEFIEISSWDYTICGIVAEPPHPVVCWGGDGIASNMDIATAV